MMSPMSRSDLVNDSPAAKLGRTQLRELIKSMCDMWDGILDDPRASQYRIDILDTQRIVAIRSHAQHAAKTARALLAVDAMSDGIEIVPLVRLLLECGVTAAWLLVTPGSGHTLLRAGAGERKKALDQLKQMGQPTSPGHEQAVSVLKDLENAEGPRSFAFEQRCLQLHQGENLYVLYRVFSAQSHAGEGVADFYVVPKADSSVGVAFHAEAHDDETTRVSALGIAACMLFLSIKANEHALAAPRRTTQIARYAKKLSVGIDILRKDGSGIPERPLA